MGGGVKKRAPDDTRPQCISSGEVERIIEDTELASVAGHGVHGIPSAGHKVQDGEEAHESSDNVNRLLHNIGPYCRRHSAFECVDESEQRDNSDGAKIALKAVEPGKQSAERDPHYNCHCKHAHAFSRRPCRQKQSGCQGPEFLAKAALHQLVRGNQFTSEVLGDEDETNNDAANQIAHDKLQKTEVLVVLHSRYADDCKGAGFRCHNGERDCPPWNQIAGEKIVLSSLLLLQEM